MPLRHALATVVLLISQLHSAAVHGQTVPMLEVHASEPKWVSGCLKVTVERVNVSSQSIYLPEWEGVFFLLPTKVIHDDPNQKNDEVWLPIYGLSDIVTYEAQPLAPGAKITDHFCLAETSAVVNQQRKTRRQVPLQGVVKIVASYFSSEEDWKTKKAEKEKQWPTPWPPPMASLNMAVPCSPRSQCDAECKTPPLIIEGDKVVVPDIFQFHKDWNERGKTVTDSLLKEDSQCNHANE